MATRLLATVRGADAGECIGYLRGCRCERCWATDQRRFRLGWAPGQVGLFGEVAPARVQRVQVGLFEDEEGGTP